MTTPLTTETMLLAWSIVLFFVHMALQGLTAMRDQGVAYNAGPRDEAKPVGKLAGRAQRTFDNFKETWPVFIALTLGLTIAGRAGGLADAGAWTWLLARIVYIPLYLLGVPWLRTLTWGVALVGLLLMLGRFF